VHTLEVLCVFVKYLVTFASDSPGLFASQESSPDSRRHWNGNRVFRDQKYESGIDLDILLS